ncbi:MAG: zinc ribbon domain-containing protein [Deltaproteobacteria bacterium]|nr:zinc ribbon domain-containing protein [Deltaproteobacteria bacterium]
MPTYVYETLPADGTAPVRFEVQQKMADAPLTAHPETGEPVMRVMTAANLGGVASTPAPSMGCGMGACGMGGCGQGN